MRAVLFGAMSTLVALGAACCTEPAVTKTAPPPLPPLSISALPIASRVETGSDAANVPTPPESRALASEGCEKDADCMLTSLSRGCCSCELDHEYAALRRAVADNGALCATKDCKMPVCGGVVRYDAAFYRAECRALRCAVVRWHTGG
ncbi:hypothetical protein BH09MYX1_BH09MYX1_18830 [soil metagenome]